MYNKDEFMASCLSYKTKDYCKNMYLPNKKDEYRKIHSILTYQIEKQQEKVYQSR
jgi:hypothetical protein